MWGVWPFFVALRIKMANYWGVRRQELYTLNGCWGVKLHFFGTCSRRNVIIQKNMDSRIRGLVKKSVKA